MSSNSQGFALQERGLIGFDPIEQRANGIIIEVL